MRIFASFAISVAVLHCGAVNTQAGQSPAASSQEAASTLSGRVKIDNQGAPGIAVALQPATNGWPLPAPVARATTDNEGRFKMTNLATGRYYLIPLAPAYYAPSDDRMVVSGKTVTIMKGDNIEGIELALTPGGVITGLVTTAGGSPVIGREIFPMLTDVRGQQFLPISSDGGGHLRFKTDDRGVYRLFGLPPGRYIVSVHTGAGGQRIETFHPNVTERSKAIQIEVLAGKAAENVDIKLPPMMNVYEVSGRVIDEATGQPIPKIRVSCRGSSYLPGVPEVNERGEFNFNNIPPGRYTVSIPMYSLSEYYSDELIIEVIDQDISGLEIKARRAASLSGRVVIEGVSDPTILSDLSHLRVSVSKLAGGGFSTSVYAGADGRFRIPGLPPDKFQVSLSSRMQRQNFRLMGVERDGVLQSEGIEVAAGEQVKGLRIIVTYGAGVVHGKVQVSGGSLPENVRFDVMARRTDIPGSPMPAHGVRADARGRFLLEGLTTGIYEIRLTPFIPLPTGGMRMTNWPQLKQTISVTSGTESQVTFVMDLNPANRKEEKR